MIYHHTEGIKFSIGHRLEIRKWIKNAIASENRVLGEVNIIYCSDEYLLKINQDSLNHDYYTDIITFDYCEGQEIIGDLFISVDRVRDNAKQVKVDFKDELHRVIIHGIMHLCGYADKTKVEKALMTEKENKYLNLLINN